MQVERVLDRNVDGIVRSQRALRSERGAGHDVLLPMLVRQEILPCQLALSERGGALEERHVHERDTFGARRVGHLLRHHLADERNRNASEAV